MDYYLTTSLARPSARSHATPKTHGPGSRLQERGHRFYSPGLGRWVSRDPIGERGGKNHSAFIQNKVVNKIDVQGLFGWWPGIPWDWGLPGANCPNIPTVPDYMDWELVSDTWGIIYEYGPWSDLAVQNGDMCLEQEENNTKKWYIYVGETSDYLDSVYEPVPGYVKIKFWMTRNYNIFDVYNAKCSCTCPNMVGGTSSSFLDCKWGVSKQDTPEKWVRDKYWEKQRWERYMTCGT